MRTIAAGIEFDREANYLIYIAGFFPHPKPIGRRSTGTIRP